MALTKTQLVAILAIIVQLVGQIGLVQYAEILQTIGTAIISILVLFNIVEAQRLKAAMVKAKLIK